MSESTSPTGTQALDRAASLVACVVRADEPITFADLQEACGLPKSTTSRLLAALEHNELIERNDEGSYVAGSLFWLYATRHDPWEELVRLAHPTLEAISEDTLETVHLAVVRGDRVVHVAQVDSQYLLGSRDWTEVDVPPHVSALGMVLLAHGCLPVPPGRLEPYTPATITNRVALSQEMQAIVTDGWALTVDQLEVGLSGVAVPVHGSRGEVIAAIGVSGPTPRLEDRTEELGKQLIKHAERLSERLRGKPQKEGAA